MYAKKVLIFNQVNSGFAVKGRQLCGMVKLVSSNRQSTQASVFVTNADVRQFGEWWVVLYVGENIYVQNLDTLNSCTFSIPETNLDSLAALLIKRDNGECRLVAESALNKTVNFAMRSSVKEILDTAENFGTLNTVFKYTPSTAKSAQKPAEKTTEKPIEKTVEVLAEKQRFAETVDNQAEAEVEAIQSFDDALGGDQPQFETTTTATFSEQKCNEPEEGFADIIASPIDETAQQSFEDQTQQVPVDTTVYEKFVAGTQNYYTEKLEMPDIERLRAAALGKLKSVEDYSTAFEKYYATGRGDNYYDSVKKEITQLFLQFPPYFPLIEKYKDSFFVRVDFPTSGRYFVLGVVEKEGRVKYICYGVPGGREGFSDKDFTYVENSPDGFWMLFQDAETGQLSCGEFSKSGG